MEGRGVEVKEKNERNHYLVIRQPWGPDPIHLTKEKRKPGAVNWTKE